MTRCVFAAVSLLAANVAAQTFTACNPLNSTCPDDPALGTAFSTSFNASQAEFDPQFFNVTAGAPLISFANDGAELTILKHGDSVTVQTSFYIFWGQVEVVFQAAAGQGIISTVTLLSDDLDEIDWEIIGGNNSFVENNYYGMGNQSQHNAQYPPLDGAPLDFHNYTIDWSRDKIDWLINGNVVRTLPAGPAGSYPQTPSFIKFGIWAGGDPTLPKGTVQWAGGPTDFTKAPFTMKIRSLRITDGTTNSTSYSYGDQTGSFQSIKSVTGDSQAYKLINKKTSAQVVQEKLKVLSTGAKIGIACAVVGFLLVAVAIFTVFCIKQRRAGKAEKAIHDRDWDAQIAELMAYRARMAKGDFAISHMGHGELKY